MTSLGSFHLWFNTRHIVCTQFIRTNTFWPSSYGVICGFKDTGLKPPLKYGPTGEAIRYNNALVGALTPNPIEVPIKLVSSKVNIRNQLEQIFLQSTKIDQLI